METIASFTVDHLKLLPGVYVSRKDCTGTDIVTTFDIRMTRPNFEPVMNTAEIHAVEHLGATFLRNHDTMGEKVVYFGPMGCRTGFYLILAGVTNLQISCLCSKKCLHLSANTKGRFREQRRKPVAITWI